MTSHDRYLSARHEATDLGLGVVEQAYLDHGITERERAARPLGTVWLQDECPACAPTVLACRRCDGTGRLWIDEAVLGDVLEQAEDDYCDPDRARDEAWDREHL